jgi:hypothetical protein
MAQYRVTLPDGSQYKVDAPEGTSEQAIRYAAQQFAREAELRTAQERLASLRNAPVAPTPAETSVGGNVLELLKGIIPGAAGLVETAGTGISALFPEGAEKATREGLRSFREAVSEPFAPGAGYEESVGRKLGEGLGSTLPFFLLGGRGAAPRVAGAGIGASAGAGEARQAAEQAGATEEQRRQATLMGIGPGLFDIVTPEVGRGIQNVMTRALVRGGVEGATEAAQRIAQNLIAQGVYNPNQPLLAGSGEEGAYGAGVGALASLIIDTTLGRRARGASATSATPQAAQAPAAPGAPTPAAPELPSTVPPSFEYPQGELFARDLSVARRQRAEQAGARPEFELTAPEAPRGEQLELPFGEPAAAPAPGQRDLIDESETAQIREMLDQDETRQIQDLLAVDQQREEEARAQQEKLRFESSLAETDARQMEAERRKTEDHRLEILRTIIAEPSVKNIQATFGDALKVAGYTDTAFTPRERQMIQRANDVRAAQPATPEAIPSAPAELGAMEALIPERRTQPPEAPRAAEPVTPPSRASVPVASQPDTGAPAAGVGVAQPARVVPPQQNVEQPVGREGAQPGAVSFVDVSRGAPAANEVPPAVTSLVERRQAQIDAQEEAEDERDFAQAAREGRANLREQYGQTIRSLWPVIARAKKAIQQTEYPGSLEAQEAARLTRGFENLVQQYSSIDDVEDLNVLRNALSQGTATVADEVQQLNKLVASISEPLTKKVKRPPTAQAPAPAPAPAAAPAAPKFTPQQMLERAEEAQRKADEAAAAAKPAKAPAKPAKPGVLDQAREGYLLAAKGNADKALDYLAHDMAYAMYPEKNVAKELNKITLDLASDKIANPKFLKRDEVYAPNTGGKYAKAFFESLSLEEYKVLTAKMRNIFQDYARTELRNNNADLAASARKLEALNQNDQTTYGLNLEAPILGMRMHPAVQDRVSSGDLVGALRVMAGLSEGTISTAATRVAEYIGTTKVEVQDKVTDEAGKAVAGRFDPATNTIYLNSSMRMSGHTLLHEGVHAVTSHILANPSHPVTRQLTALYKNALPYLDTAYGARSLDEFVAEAFSNPQFQEKLAGIPAEGNTTVFQRFIRAVQNLVRRMMGMDAKPMESVMDATDRLVMEIMAPAPDSRGAGSLYAAAATGQAERTLDVYGANAMAAPTLTQERLYKFREFFQGTAPDAAKNLMRASLPLNALEDLARSRIPAATRIATLIDERAGSENKRNQLIEPVVKRTTDWAATNAAKVDSLNSVIYNSTLYQVDPSKPRTDYAGKVDESGNKLDAVWDFLQPKWRELGEDGRGIYKQMRDTYAALHKDVERVLFNRIDDALKDDPEAAKSTKAEIYKRLFAGGKIEPYFPLTRTGKYWLSYTADGEFYVEAFETSAMREDAIKELRGTQGVDGSSIQKFANISQINYRNVPATSFVNNILQTMEASKKGASAETKAKIDETISGVMNLFLNTLPETSFAQSFRRRKGTLGFKQDAVRALRSKSYSLSRQLANIEYGAKLESARRDMQEHIKANGSQEQDVAYMEEFNKRIDFAISPNVPEWSKWLTSAGFAMTLGFNVSSAVVNLAQIPIVVMPYLGGRYGYGATTAAVGRATRIFTGSGFSREAEMLVPVKDDKGNEVEKSLKVRAAPSIDNYDFNDPKNKDIKHLETLVRVAGSRGQLNRSMSYDVLEVDQNESITSRINKYSGFVFHHGERMNRQVAMVTAYELELNRLNKPGAKLQEDLLTPQGVLPKGMLASSLSAAQREEYAANQAIYLTEMTNGGTSAASAPRIAQGGIGRVAFMYKRYGVAMYYMMFKNLRQVIDKETDPEVRKAALKQLVGIQASAALFAGAKGLTAYGIAASIYNLFFADEDEDDFDTLARKSLPEWAYSGALNYLTGAEISSRVGLSDLLFRDSAVPSPNTGLAVLAEQLGGPVWGIGNRVIRGVGLINEGNVERGVEQILPSAMASVLKSIRFAQEGALTMRGDPVTQEFGTGQLIGQVFGFTPAEYTRQLEINSAMKKIDRAANEEKTKLLRQYYIALRMGDQDGVQSTAEKMQKFNARHPSNAITTDTIANSLAQHMKTTQEMVSGVLYSKKMRPEIMRELARFEEGGDDEE